MMEHVPSVPKFHDPVARLATMSKFLCKYGKTDLKINGLKSGVDPFQSTLCVCGQTISDSDTDGESNEWSDVRSQVVRCEADEEIVEQLSWL